MPNKRAARPVQFGPRERRVYYGPKKPRWLKSPSEVGVRTVLAMPGGKIGKNVKITGDAFLEVNLDMRHLADAMRTAIAVHTGRAAGAAVDPATGRPHGRIAKITSRAAYDREITKGGAHEDYTPTRWVKRGPNKGNPSAWTRPRLVRSGDTADSWRVGKITGNPYSAKTLVYASDDPRVRMAIKQLVADGYDPHTVRGDVEVLIGKIVRDFITGGVGRGVVVPPKPPNLVARIGSAIGGAAWYFLR